MVCVGGGAREEDEESDSELRGTRPGIGNVERDNEDAEGVGWVSGGRRGGCGAERNGRGGGAIAPGRGGGAIRPGGVGLVEGEAGAGAEEGAPGAGATKSSSKPEREKLGTGAARGIGAAFGVVIPSSSSASSAAVMDVVDIGTCPLFSGGALARFVELGAAAASATRFMPFSSTFCSSFGGGGDGGGSR